MQFFFSGWGVLIRFLHLPFRLFWSWKEYSNEIICIWYHVQVTYMLALHLYLRRTFGYLDLCKMLGPITWSEFDWFFIFFLDNGYLYFLPLSHFVFRNLLFASTNLMFLVCLRFYFEVTFRIGLDSVTPFILMQKLSGCKEPGNLEKTIKVWILCLKSEIKMVEE